MVWGGISHGVRTHVVLLNENLTAVRYGDQVHQPHVTLRQTNHTLQFHYAIPHVARVGRDCLATTNVQVTDWTYYNADLSTIENLWDEQRGEEASCSV